MGKNLTKAATTIKTLQKRVQRQQDQLLKGKLAAAKAKTALSQIKSKSKQTFSQMKLAQKQTAAANRSVAKKTSSAKGKPAKKRPQPKKTGPKSVPAADNSAADNNPAQKADPVPSTSEPENIYKRNYSTNRGGRGGSKPRTESVKEPTKGAKKDPKPQIATRRSARNAKKD